jgi:hypothetical protein
VICCCRAHETDLEILRLGSYGLIEKTDSFPGQPVLLPQGPGMRGFEQPKAAIVSLKERSVGMLLVKTREELIGGAIRGLVPVDALVIQDTCTLPLARKLWRIRARETYQPGRNQRVLQARARNASRLSRMCRLASNGAGIICWMRLSRPITKVRLPGSSPSSFGTP